MKLFSITLIILLSLSVNAQTDLPVSWKLNIENIKSNTATLAINAVIKKGWVLYGVDNQSSSPISTKISLNGAESLSDITSSPKPTVEYDNYMEQEMVKHKTPTTFSQKVKFDNNTASVTVTYMACNSKSCLPPTTEVLTVDFK